MGLFSLKFQTVNSKIGHIFTLKTFFVFLFSGFWPQIPTTACLFPEEDFPCFQQNQMSAFSKPVLRFEIKFQHQHHWKIKSQQFLNSWQHHHYQHVQPLRDVWAGRWRQEWSQLLLFTSSVSIGHHRHQFLEIRLKCRQISVDIKCCFLGNLSISSDKVSPRQLWCTWRRRVHKNLKAPRSYFTCTCKSTNGSSPLMA